MSATYIKDIPDVHHQHLQSKEREQEFVEEENYMTDPDNFLLTPDDFRTHMVAIVQMFWESFSYFRACMQDIQKREKILQEIRRREQERIQKRENKTTKATKSRHLTTASLLLGSVFFASRFCSVGAEFIPVESDLSLCKTDLSKLTDTCDHNEGKAIHCVLNDEAELGIGCFLKIWVKQGYCPYFRNSFGVLDIRPCLGNSSICPTYQYLSNGVYKYPGCLINSSTGVLVISTIQTTQSTIIRSSDAGDKETMLLIFVVILGLITFSLLLIHGLRYLRSMKIISRGLRSAYVPASMGHQDPHDLPDDGVDV